MCWAYGFTVSECRCGMMHDDDDECEQSLNTKLLNTENCKFFTAAADRCTQSNLVSVLSTTSCSLQSEIANCNCSGYTTTTSTCNQVTELTSVPVKVISTFSCPSTTVSFNYPTTHNTNGEATNLVITAVTTTSVLTTTVKASCNAMPISANSSSTLPIAIISSVLTTILVMIVVVLIVVCLYMQLKKKCTCMCYVLVECVPVYALI